MEFEEYKIVPEVIPAVPASVAKISYVSGGVFACCVIK